MSLDERERGKIWAVEDWHCYLKSFDMHTVESIRQGKSSRITILIAMMPCSE